MTNDPVTNSSPPEAKIALFRSLFRGRGEMEVDLLCAEARLAVEIDGAQHLNDPEAYRRDRRKDALLQENGYIVLRFLAEDIGKRFDEVLDRILRTLQHRKTRFSNSKA